MKKKGILRLILATMLVALPMMVLKGRSFPSALPETGGYSTVVFAQLLCDSNDVTANTDYEVTAFIGDESRAKGKIMALPDGAQVLVFRVWGDIGVKGEDETGKKITFRLHDCVSGKDYDVAPDEDITFRGDYTYGMPSAPVALRFSLEQGVPIESLTAGKDHLFVYLGEIDIRERLDSLISVLPAESKQTYHWEVEQESVDQMLTINDESGLIDAVSEGVATVVAVADADPSVRSAAVKVTVVNPARSLASNQESTTVYINGQGSHDVSDEVNGLIFIGPRGYSSIRVSYASSDPTVVSTSRDESSGRQTFLAHKPGAAVITTALTYFDCFTESDTTITMDVTVYVSLPITGVVASAKALTVDRDSLCILTLTAQPEGAVLTAEHVSLSLSDANIARIGDFEIKDGATSVEVPVEGLFPGTTSVLNVFQAGGQPQALTTVDVVAPLKLKEGWQWISLYLPATITGEALEDAFGPALTEVRSQSQFLFNDPDYGYIGSLYDNGLHRDVCYKIDMAADASHVFDRPEGALEPYAGGTVSLSNRWTWLGNPYYCNHPLEGYVSGAQEDDMIVGKDAFAVFSDGRWDGSLEALRYGEAYLYYADQGLTTLQLKEEGYISDVPVDEADEEELGEEEEEVGDEEVSAAPAYYKKDTSRDRSAFTPCNGRRFMDNMCVIAALGDGFSATGDSQIGAFVGNECRGTARIKGGRFFLTVHGDAGETIRLRLFDENSNAYYDIQGALELQPLVGSMRSPLLVQRGGSDTLVLGVSEQESEDCYYTLQGLRLRQASRKGIYIHKGHKVAVR